MSRGPAESRRAHPSSAGVLVALFLSGAAGLVDEVLWIRRSSLVFGSTVHALSTVLTVFFLGLALGGWVFGQVAQRARRPLAVCARLEVGLALLVLVTLPALGAVEGVYGILFRALPLESPLLWAARAALIAVVLLPPAFLMGGTLPLVVRSWANDARVGRTIARLYAINTLGGVAGALLAGYALVPGIGMSRGIVVAAACNLLAATLLQRAPAAELEPAPTRLADAPVASSARAVVTAVVFLTGFVALGEEVVWTRFLALLVHNSVRTYTLTLALVLAGIVIGSLLVARLADRPAVRTWLLGALPIASGLLVWALFLMPPAAWRALGGEAAVAAVLLLPPAILSGATFPLAVRVVVASPEWAGIGIGRMLAINTAGGIAGALATGFFLLPGLGVQNAALVCTALSLLAGIGVWTFLARGGSVLGRLAPAAAAIAVWASVPGVTHVRVPETYLADPGQLIDHREGLESNLAVVRGASGQHVLEIDRWWQGQDRKTHQIMAAHLPMMLHPGPRTVLVIGVGAGQTPARFLMYPIERLDCVDIEPRVFDLVRANFPSAWMDDPRARLLRTDGRNFLTHTADRYDLISLEVGQLFRPGVASFYTEDFYRRAAAHLRPGGIVAQFVALPFLAPDDLRGVVATFLAVFPHASLWYNTAELLLVGSREQTPRLESNRVAAAHADPAIGSDLQFSPWGGPQVWLSRPEALAGSFLCGDDGLHRLAGGAATYRDDRPVLEYAASRVRESDARELACLPLIRAALDSVARGVNGLDATRTREADAIREENLADIAASADLRRVDGALARGDGATATALLEHASAVHPGNVVALRRLGGVQLMLGDVGAAESSFRRALALSDRDPLVQSGLGMVALRTGNLAEAASRLRAAIALDSTNAETHNSLGAALGQMGDLQGALAEFEQALALDPKYEEAHRNAERTRAAGSRR